jgi:hypothetical protein
MAEFWRFKTYDGEEYELKVITNCGPFTEGGTYNLLRGTMGHYGIPSIIQSDLVPGVAGAEVRNVVREVSSLFLPLQIVGRTAAECHHNVERLRKSLNPDYEAQLWVSNEEGDTRVLYCRYKSGFPEMVDDEKRNKVAVKVPLYVEADNPFWYDPPGSEVDQLFTPDPWDIAFLTKTVTMELTQNANANQKVLHVADSTGCVENKTIVLIDTLHSESCVIHSVDSATQLTMVSNLAHSYTTANGAYFYEIDETDTFLSPADTETRTVNANCNLVIFWLRGCPPCYAAKAQLEALKVLFPSLTITYVEIQDPDASADGIGMTAALELYPEGYAFAMACGPPLPDFYEVIDGIMPAVICVYRGGMFIDAFCGVHTTGKDPVSDDVILDACGPRLAWRLGTRYIGAYAVVNNTGETTAYPVWTIQGPGVVPRIINISTGDELELDHVLLAGETVIVDTREGIHSCGSNRQSEVTGAGYYKIETCPTCQGSGVIPAACCGGTSVCPTCKGTGVISVWESSSYGPADVVGDLYNLRSDLTSTTTAFWGFRPGPNVITLELGAAELGVTQVELNLVRRYGGA